MSDGGDVVGYGFLLGRGSRDGGGVGRGALHVGGWVRVDDLSDVGSAAHGVHGGKAVG